jgi:POT family proton-dependent oligopeptide transporter
MARRDAGFSIFYFGIYLGAFSAPLIAGTLGETLGYRWGFFAAGIAMIIGLIQFHATRHWLEESANRPHNVKDRAHKHGWTGVLVLAATVMLGLTFRNTIPLNALQFANMLGIAMVAMAIFFTGYVLQFGRLDRTERWRVVVILILCFCAALFLAGIEQSGSTMNLFARDYTDRTFLGRFFEKGLHPVSWYQSIGPVFILLLSPVFAWIWMTLGKRNRDPSTPVKFGLSLILLGTSSMVMAAAVHFSISMGLKASPGWLISVFFLQTVGELCIGPIGLASVTKLSPARFAGQMMGMWFLAAAIGSLAAGVIGGSISAGAIDGISNRFLNMAMIGLGTGLVMVIASRPICQWMNKN